MIHVLEAGAHRVVCMGLSALVSISPASYRSQRAHPYNNVRRCLCRSCFVFLWE